MAITNIETRLTFKGSPFLIEAYDSETEAVLGTYALTRELDRDWLGRMRFVGSISSEHQGTGVGSALLDRAMTVLTDYATRKQMKLIHDVTISTDAPAYVPAMFERRGYERHDAHIYSLVFHPCAKEDPFVRLDQKVKAARGEVKKLETKMKENVKERFKNIKKRISFVG